MKNWQMAMIVAPLWQLVALASNSGGSVFAATVLALMFAAVGAHGWSKDGKASL